MQRKLKVLQLQSRFNVNSSDLAEQIIRALPAEEYEVTSAYLKGRHRPGDMESIAPNVKYFEFNNKLLKGMRKEVIEKLLKFCSERKFDIIIAHRFKPLDIALRLNHKVGFSLCIGVSHGIGDYDRFYRKLSCRYHLRENCKVVAVSNPVKNYLLHSKAGFTEKNTVTINNAIDIEQAVTGLLTKIEARQNLSIPNNSFVFGTIGRLVPVKGHIYFLKAFSLLAEKYPDIHGVIIGGGRLEDELKRYVIDHDLSDRITFTGKIDNAFRFAKAFDVFILPSLSEGLPLALLEAMSASIPVIGSDIPSIKPIVKNVGRIFKSQDEFDLSKSMENYLNMDTSRLEATGIQHFSYVKKHHSITNFRLSYLNLIESFLSFDHL